MWVEFGCSRPCSGGFSPGPPVFLSPHKPKFQVPIRPGNSGQDEPPPRMSTAEFHSSSSSYYYYYYYYCYYYHYFKKKLRLTIALLRDFWRI